MLLIGMAMARLPLRPCRTAPPQQDPRSLIGFIREAVWVKITCKKLSAPP